MSFASRYPLHDELIYEEGFVEKDERVAILKWLEGITPIWEERHGGSRQPREGQKRRRLLRPVYWLGGWQPAALNYYHPPEHTAGRVIEAEPYPEALAPIVARIEALVQRKYEPTVGYRLNTCLINFYGLERRGDRWVDRARVGGHRDFEPGPVASLSFGSRARFQFATRRDGPPDENVVWEEWLRDRSLLAFGGARFKKELFHRVPRVARQEQYYEFPIELEGFRIHRVNMTFRHVPHEHIVAFSELPTKSRALVRPYIEQLAKGSSFFAAALADARY